MPRLWTLYVPGSCHGRYHADRQTGTALQNRRYMPHRATGPLGLPR